MFVIFGHDFCATGRCCKSYVPTIALLECWQLRLSTLLWAERRAVRISVSAEGVAAFCVSLPIFLCWNVQRTCLLWVVLAVQKVLPWHHRPYLHLHEPFCRHFWQFSSHSHQILFAWYISVALLQSIWNGIAPCAVPPQLRTDGVCLLTLYVSVTRLFKTVVKHMLCCSEPCEPHNVAGPWVYDLAASCVTHPCIVFVSILRFKGFNRITGPK